MKPFGFYGGIDNQALAAFNSLQAAGFTCPQGLIGINAAFKTIKTIYGTSDITTAISFFGDPSLSYEIGSGIGTTAGQAIRTLPNLVDSTRATDAAQTTAASQPLLLLHGGENYYQGVGVGGNNITTPSSVNNELVNDFSIEWKVQPLILSGAQVICSKDGGSGLIRQFQFRFNGSSLQLVIDHSSGTQIVYNSTANIPFSANQLFWVRVSRNATTGIIQFFTSPDGVTYTQLGTNVSGYIGALSNPNRIVEIGTTANTAAIFSGKLFQGRIFKDSTFTTPTQIFNPNQYNAANSQTQWTSSTGEVWTINTGTATTGYKGVLVDRNIMQGDGVDDRLTTGTLATRQYFTRFAALNYLVGQSPEYIIAGNPVETHLIYFNAGILRLYNTGQEINVSGAIANNLQLITGDYNGVSSKVRRNNAADVTGTTGAVTSTILNLFSSGSGGLFSNAIITTLIDTVAVSNDAQKTAMYNYIRSINNNAF